MPQDHQRKAHADCEDKLSVNIIFIHHVVLHTISSQWQISAITKFDPILQPSLHLKALRKHFERFHTMPTKQGHKSVQDGDLPLVREAADEQGADVRETYTTSFPFLQLPTELRLRVYREVLVQSRPIELWPHVPNNTIGMANLQRATTMRLYRENIQPRLQLLRTNKLIHAEASEMFYGENEWRFSGINAWMVFSCWLHTIGQPHFKWLKHVVLHVPFEGKDFVAYPTYVTSNWVSDLPCIFAGSLLTKKSASASAHLTHHQASVPPARSCACRSNSSNFGIDCTVSASTCRRVCPTTRRS
jgi:hypothetical protein